MARKKTYNTLHFEELEPRLLFSADIAEAFAEAAVVEEYVEEPAIIVEFEEQPAANGTAAAPPEEIPPPAPETSEKPDAAETNTSSQLESEGIDAPLPAGEPADTTADNESTTGESSEKSGSRELVIVNDNVKDHDQLTTAILEADESRSIEVLILNSEEDGIQQVTSVLDGQSDLDAIHFITHGRDGFLSLGSDWLDKSDLLENSETIAGWGDALSPDGEFLLYGCSIAADETGEEFIDLLSELTGADISASDDKTGHDNLGGDWDLEYSTGSTEATSLLSTASQQGWGNLLSGTVADDFSSGDFSTSTGTIAWSNDWQKIDESDGADFGNILVYPHIFYGSQPLLSLWKTDGIGVWREADLSGASYGVLSFDYAHYMTEATDSVIVDISTDGSTWDVLADLRFVGTHDELQSTSYDISPYISATTQIRFRTINFSANDDFLLDNIFIELAPNVLTVNTTNDTVDGNTGSIAALLADPGADGISLREAIIATNNTNGADVINFDIDGTGPHTISVGSGGLPAITDTVLIDGTSEPDFSGTPVIELEGSGAGASADGIVIGDGSLAGSGSTIRGLVINSFGGAGIYVMNADDVTIQGNFIGTDVSGVLDRGNSDDGISVDDSDRIQIGGTSQADRNIISYNGSSGIFLWGGTNDGVIEGNYIGTNITGLSAAGNFRGVEIADDTSDGNRIGGATPGAGNLISGNLSEGIYIYGADNTEIYGNLIGTDITGIAPLANGDAGIRIDSFATNNLIGGITPGEANIIAFNNHDGLHIETAGNTIRANVIYSNTAPNQIHLGAGGNTTAVTPAVSSATSSGGTTTITVSVSGASGSTPYGVDLFSTPTNDQQGQVYLGSVTVTGNPQVVVLNNEVTDGHFITATSTNTVGETSEFCSATPVTGPAISNIAPILDPTFDLALSPYIEDGALPAGPVGTLVRDLVGLQGEGTIENVIDPDASGVTGIAIIAADTANGTWHYSTDDGAVWNPLGAVSINSALLLAADNATTRIYFKPNASFVGTISEAIYFRAWDQSDNNSNGTSGIDTTLHSGTTAFSLMFDSASISALGEGNDAPVLSDDDHALTAIDEDIFDSAGDSVTSIIVNGSISDQDGAAVESIAITAVDNSNGTWQYSIDNGSSWQGVDDGSLAVNHSLLLDGTIMGGSTHKLRFVPDNDFNGTASFTFRAWDMTMGDAGTYDNTSSSGGTTPYSTQTDTASITVNPVNDLPSGTGDLTTTSLNDTDVDVNLFENISVTDPDNEIDLSLTITLSNPGAGTLSGGGLTDLGGGVYTRSALTATDTNTALDGIQFTPVANTGASGTFTTDFTVVINDGESGDIVIVPATTVTVTRVNDTPTAVTLDNLSVDENSDGAIIGSLTTNDPDTGDSHSYSVDDARFEVVGGQLKLVAGQTLDHETEPTVDITVISQDSGGLTTNQLFTITVNNVNDAPTAIALDNLAVDENTAGAIVGSLSTTDQDTGDTHIYTVDDGRFEVVGGQLKLAAGQSLDQETEPTVAVNITAQDSGGETTSQLFTITVNDINDAPTAITLDNLTVDENASGAVIGNLTTTDQDTGDSHSYSVDDARFEVVGGQLKLAAEQSLDQETEPTVDITVTATDSGGAATNQLFTITVNDINDAPTAIALDNLTVDENTAGAIVGNLSTTDQDTGDTHTYTVDDGRFEVVAGQLKLAAGQSLDQETEPTVDITVTATDSGGAATDQLFTITVNDINDAPTAIALDNLTVDENTAGAIVGSLSTSDQDTGDSHSYTVDDVRFEVVGGQLKLAAGQSLDQETEPTVDITVTATDSGSLTTNQLFTVNVNDINDAPTSIALDNLSVDENVAGAIVGSLTTTDQDIGDSHSYTVDDVRFEVVAGQLKLVNGQSLDHETEPTVDITVTTTDSGSLTTNQFFTISVNNVNDLPTAITLDNLTVDENTAGAIVGSLSTTDQDTGDTHTYTVDDGRFEVVAGQLKLVAGQSLDHETEPTVDITVTATDSGGAATNQLFTITVNDSSDPPTAITLDNLTVDENSAGAIIGNLTTTDQDIGDSHSYTVDDVRFEVVAGQLKLANGQSLDHETEPTVDITVTTTDSGSLTTIQLFTITVNNVNEAPIITGDATGSVTEDIDPDLDTLIETFGAMTIFDPDAGESSFTADEINGAYGTFTIDTTGRWDYSADNTQTGIQQLDDGQIVTESFTVSTADGTTRVVTIDVHGAEDAPVLQTAIPDQVASEDLPFDFSFAASTFSDADTSDSLTYTATLSDDSPLPSWLSFNAATRNFSGTPTEADVGNISIRVSASDGSNIASALFTLGVANTNDTPLAADDSAATDQNSPVTTGDVLANDTFGDGTNFLLGFDAASTQGGTVVYNNDGTFTYTPATDFSGNDTFTYTISDSDGEVSSATVTITVTPGIVATPDSEEITETEETVEEIITATDTVEDTESVEVSVVAEQEPAAQPEPVAAEAILEQSPAIEEAEEPGKPDVVTPNKNSDDSPAAPIDKPVNETHVKDHAEEYTTDDQQVMQVANVQARVDAQAQPVQKPEARQINQVQPATQDSSTTTLLLKRFLDRVKFNSEMEYSRAIMQLREALDEFQEEAENDVHFQKTVIGSAIAVSTGLSVGYVVWLIRGGMLLSSVLFSMPAWQIADPLPLLANSREDEEEDEETLESIIKRGAAGKGESPEADNDASL